MVEYAPAPDVCGNRVQPHSLVHTLGYGITVQHVQLT